MNTSSLLIIFLLPVLIIYFRAYKSYMTNIKEICCSEGNMCYWLVTLKSTDIEGDCPAVQTNIIGILISQGVDVKRFYLLLNLIQLTTIWRSPFDAHVNISKGNETDNYKDSKVICNFRYMMKLCDKSCTLKHHVFPFHTKCMVRRCLEFQDVYAISIVYYQMNYSLFSVKRFCRKGIPSSLRPKVWKFIQYM